ncbi:hypothetical protein [Pontibacter amylolyticus]|uniref:Lipoprotein n=1 Tax=Pontibacter amylolyticus TaxID=1424080 RepID=A0ABQ1WEL4_9BACT|nr:hypothetical protein [Pontibacter amylolyticus]GGG26803.1 hypothetical protein GCM10011323_32990 [Pontibacter amylolyticus]
MKTKKILVVLLIGVLSACSPKAAEKVGSTTTVENKSIDWEVYETASSVQKDEINVELLQGEWSAYKGVYKFGEHLNAMKLEKPFIIEVKDDTYRRNKNSDFAEFAVNQNIITQKKDSKTETGIINKLTENELTITWKDGENYTRYYYEKSK